MSVGYFVILVNLSAFNNQVEKSSIGEEDEEKGEEKMWEMSNIA